MAASAPRTDRIIVFASWRRCALPSETSFLKPTRVGSTNGISISLAVFVRLTGVPSTQQTDKQITERATIGRIRAICI